MFRASLSGLLGGLLALAIASPRAYADRKEEPPAVVPAEDGHRFTPAVQGAVGGAGVLALLIGGALTIQAHVEYDALLEGSQDGTCRPCSVSQLASTRAQAYIGDAFLGIGGVLLVSDIVILALDAKYRSEHKRPPGNSLALAPLSGGFRF